MIKAIFFDMDGTLLNSDSKISELSKTALNRCKSNGVKLFIATGRPPLLKKMLNLTDEEIDLFDGGIYYNGGCIICNQTKIYSPVPYDVFLKTPGTASLEPNTNLAIQMAGEKHSFLHELPNDQYSLWGLDENSVLPFNHPWDLSIIKMLFFNWYTPLGKVYEKLMDDIGTQANVYLTGKGTCVEVVSKGTSKKSAIDHIINKLCLDPDEIAVFGDDHNDMEMLEGYNYSVAMGNSDAKIKERANFITLSNDQDGIYHALKEYLKLA